MHDLPSKHLSGQCQKNKHQINVCNWLEGDNKNIRMT